MRRFIITIILTISIIFGGIAQKAILNENYKTTKQGLKIVLTPYFSMGSKEVNDIFFQTFSNGSFIVTDTSKIIHNIFNHDTFNNSLRKITYLDFDKKKLKQKPNLYSSLSEKEIEDFKVNTLNSDIIIIGSKIESKKVTKLNGIVNIYLSGNIIVFDLRTGEFIIQCSNKIKSHYDKTCSDTPYPIKELIESLCKCFEKNLK